MYVLFKYIFSVGYMNSMDGFKVDLPESLILKKVIEQVLFFHNLFKPLEQHYFLKSLISLVAFKQTLASTLLLM